MDNLQSLLRERGVRQNELADALGVSEPTLSRWANRGADIPARYIGPIAVRLGVPVEKVLAVAVKGEGDPEAPPALRGVA
jgi:transcriptional regulator with XRE-family HTH domain